MQESTALLDSVSLDALRGKKNLLAFSGGVDSTALFFLLMEADIEFDIALVNYNTRASSKDEEEYARGLGGKYGKKCFVLSANPPQTNFEAEARRIRYEFFEEIIAEHGYCNLVTAHQLNDRLEWFLMRLSKGAGITELIGGGGMSCKDSYTVVKPLFKTSRDEIYEYLKATGNKYFEDETNAEQKFERNRMRAQFASPFTRLYKDGIVKSFEILENQAALFKTRLFEADGITVFISGEKEVDGVNVSLALKKLGYLPSKAQRDEILKGFDAVVGGRFAVSKNKKGLVFVSSYVADVVMDENFRELCRTLDIPPKHRGFLYANGVDVRRLARETTLFFAQ